MLIKNDSPKMPQELRRMWRIARQWFSSPGRRRTITAVCFVMTCWMAVTAVLLYHKGEFYQELRESLKSVKYLPSYALHLPQQIYRRITVPVPTLSIEIQPEDYQRLMTWRSEALQSYVVSAKQKEFVGAKLRYNDGEAVSARVRLKGDGAVTHMSEPKWSLRVVTEEEAPIHGMSRFSLQHPKRRSFMRSYLFHRLLKEEGDLGINFDLVKVIINGADRGIYNLEEVPGKEMIRRGQRSEGVVLRFNESLHMIDNLRGREDMENVYQVTSIKTIGQNYILENPVLSKQFNRAADLLNGFRYGDLDVADVFDMDAMARWMVIGDLLGCWHGFSWGNLRFYYDPDIDKLQPLAWDGVSENNTADAASFLKGRIFRLEDTSMDPSSVLWRDLFASTEYLEKYLSTLDQFTQEGHLEARLEAITSDFRRYEGILQTEYPQFKFATELERIKENRDFIRRVFLYPAASFHAYFEDKENGLLTLAIVNRKPVPVEILGIYDPVRGLEYLPSKRGDVLRGYVKESLAQKEFFQFHVPDFVDWDKAYLSKLKVRYRLLGLKDERLEEIIPWQSYDSARVERQGGILNSNIEQFDFLDIRIDSKEIFFRPGKWTLIEDMRIPEGFVVRVGAGTELEFQGGSIYSGSPFIMEGSEDHPIVIRSTQETGGGLFFLRTGLTSRFSFVQFRDLNVPRTKGWDLHNAITFYESPVYFDHCVFEETTADNYLALVRSKFQLRRSAFRSGSQNGISIEFSEGVLANVSLFDIGGTAVNLVGGKVIADQLYINGAQQVGIRFDENSRLELTNSAVTESSIAIDGSQAAQLAARHIIIKDCETGYRLDGHSALINDHVVISVIDGQAESVQSLTELAADAVMNYNGRQLKGRPSIARNKRVMEDGPLW